MRKQLINIVVVLCLICALLPSSSLAVHSCIDEDQFRVVGNADFMGSWDPACDAGLMQQISLGVYEKTFENVVPGIYEIMVTQNGTWEHFWGDGSCNFSFTVAETSPITVTFALIDGEGIISVKGKGLYHLPGDLTGNRMLDVDDVAQLHAVVCCDHAYITDELLSYADLNGDGRLNVADVAKLCSLLQPAEKQMLENPNWGLTLTAENVTPTGLTLVFTQSGGEPTGSLETGCDYSLKVLKDNKWENVPGFEGPWTMEAYLLPMDDTSKWDIDWEWLCVLPAGQYRIEKEIMDYRGPGDYDKAVFFAEFEIT